MNKFMTSAKDFFASPGNPDALLRKYVVDLLVHPFPDE
jgi:hypothetical protein